MPPSEHASVYQPSLARSSRIEPTSRSPSTPRSRRSSEAKNGRDDVTMTAIAASSAPIHTLVAEEAIKGLESRFHGDYQPGDFIVANDPYVVRGGHLPDWNFIRPLFYHGEHLGFFQAKTHVSDTGGFLPGGYGAGAYDIIAEGLNIPPLKIIKAGPEFDASLCWKM